MVTLQSAESALKSVYLNVVANQLNINANPLLGKIKQTTKDVWGKEIIKLAPYGINGGIGAGTETGNLPTATGNKYAQFKAELKNLYGRIELSDKAIRASANDAGAFVNLLNDEMEGLIKASSYNLSRMLYGNGTGILSKVTIAATASKEIAVDSTRNFVEGMLVDIYSGTTKSYSAVEVVYVDRANSKITLATAVTVAKNDELYVQGSKGLEISGIGRIFDTGETTLYGLLKADYKWLTPVIKTSVGTIGDVAIQSVIDAVEDNCGSEINFISCSSKTRRAYQAAIASTRTNLDFMTLQGGFKAISYAGIPVVADRFVEDGEMYLLNTNDFTLHQLCDWKWLEGENGRILKQNAGQATYSATLVKYAELICDRPCGQAKMTGITVS